jgi:hypothetical protein
MINPKSTFGSGGLSWTWERRDIGGASGSPYLGARPDVGFKFIIQFDVDPALFPVSAGFTGTVGGAG